MCTTRKRKTDSRRGAAVLLLLAAIGALPSFALADFSGRVVKVSDGDTLTVLAGGTPTSVRLDAIDAPEMRQAFGKYSRQSLQDLCAGKIARVAERGKDRYGRTVGRVTCASIDANSEQVRRGMAWVFDRYAPAKSPLYGLQHEAQAIRRGLWSDPAPIPPWDWRAARRRG
jgi:endonuclease YncB( thermonuclease family)